MNYLQSELLPALIFFGFAICTGCNAGSVKFLSAGKDCGAHKVDKLNEMEMGKIDMCPSNVS